MSAATNLRFALDAGAERGVGEERDAAELPLLSLQCSGLEVPLAQFVDAAPEYRFGAPGADLIAVALKGRNDLGARANDCTTGRALVVESADTLGLSDRARMDAGGVVLKLHSHCFVRGLRLRDAGLEPTGDAFSREPRVPSEIELVSDSGGTWGLRSNQRR